MQDNNWAAGNLGLSFKTTYLDKRRQTSNTLNPCSPRLKQVIEVPIPSDVFGSNWWSLKLHNLFHSQCRNGCVDVWDLETRNKDCSLSISNTGFCRLATLASFDGGMLKYSTPVKY